MAHIHELYDFVTSVFIVHDNKVLLVNHPRYGIWICPGGHIELNEDPEEGLFREIKEETGLEVTLLATPPPVQFKHSKMITLPAHIDVHEANAPHKHIAFVYYAVAKSSKFIASDEHTEVRWFTEEELKDPKYDLSDATQYYCHEALELARKA